MTTARLYLVRETKKARLFTKDRLSDGARDGLWIPKSQTRSLVTLPMDGFACGTPCEVEMTDAIAREKGLE